MPAEALAKAGLPFAQVADFMDFFRFMGGSLAVLGIFLFIFGKKFQLSYRPVAGSEESVQQIATSSDVRRSPRNDIMLPKLSIQSLLFIIVIGGFLINQYLMYSMGIFDKMGSSAGSVASSVMKPLSRMKLTPFDVVLAKERMDKNNDGICDVCGMKIEQCIESGQLDCNMGNNKDAIGLLGSQHIHADFKVYVNGQVLDFSDKDHMDRMRKNLSVSSFIHVDSGSPAPEKTGDILHMHATNVPLWLFFKSIGMKLEKDSLTLDNGQVLKSGDGNTLKFYLAGKKVDDLDSYVFQDLDKLLISYGPENDPDIQRQLNSLTNFAKNH